jgi:malate permease and related proteins
MAPELVLVLVALAGGYLARKLGRFPDNASDVLNRFVIDVCVPATILRLVPTLTMRWDLLLLVVTPWLMVALALAASRLLRRALHLDAHSATVLFLCTALSNTSFLGFPLISALCGEAAVSLAAVYDQLGSFLILCTVAPLALARATGGPRQSAAEMAKRVLAFPPFLALLAALIPWPQPAWLAQVLLQLSRALIPVAMFAVGLRLRVTPPAQRAAFAAGLGLKLVLLPACALGLAELVGAAPEVRDVAVLETAMPAMITAGAMAMAANVAPALAAALVGWGLLLAQITVPIWASVLRG